MFRTLALLVACAGLCPAADPPAKDALGDPLPKGAIARLGTERMRAIDLSSPMLLHPDGKHLIATVRGKLSLVDFTTGQPTEAFGTADVGRGMTDVSADGKRVLLATAAGFAVWDVPTAKAVCEVKREKGETAARLTPNGKFLMTGVEVSTADRGVAAGVTVRVYEADTGKEFGAITLPQNGGGAVAVSADGKRAVTWGLHRERAANPFGGGGFGGGGARPPAQPVPDESKDPNRQVQFWNAESGRELGSVFLEGGRSRGSGLGWSVAAAITPAGDVAAVSTGEGAITLFDPANGKQVREMYGRSGMGQSLTFSPDGTTLAAAASDGTVQLFEVASGKSLGFASPPAPADRGTFSGVRGFRDTGTTPSVAFTGPKTAVAAARVGSAPVVWEVPSGKELTPTAGIRQPIGSLVFTAADKELITAGTWGETIRWGLDGKRLGEVAFDMPQVQEDSFARNPGPVQLPACGTLAVRGGLLARSTGVYDLPGGKQRFAVPGGNEGLAASADGTAVAFASSQLLSAMVRAKPKVVVVDVANGTKTIELPFPEGRVSGLWLSTDGGVVGVLHTPGGRGAKAVCSGYTVADGKKVGEFEWRGGAVTQTTATPDGKGLLTAVAGDMVATIDFAAGEQGRELKGIEGVVSAPPAFSRDGKRVAVAAEKEGVRTVRVFDWTTGKQTHSFSGHAGTISCLAFSGDGKTLASGSYDTTLLLWDVSKEH
jgi:WD40 repeat protein